MLEAIVTDRRTATLGALENAHYGHSLRGKRRSGRRCVPRNVRRQALAEVGLDPSPRSSLPNTTHSADNPPEWPQHVGAAVRAAERRADPVRDRRQLRLRVPDRRRSGSPTWSWVTGTISMDRDLGTRRYASFVTGVSGANRLILYDTRGIGLSDPIDVEAPPSIELLADDVVGGLDAARSDRGI